MKFHLPECQAIRRLAASLATSLVAQVDGNDGLDMAQSARHFLRRFPWTGRHLLVPARRTTPMEGTVGQFFAAFNWVGVPLAVTEADTAPHEAETQRVRIIR